MLRSVAYTLSPIAITGDTFARFGPYVPAMDDDGAVAFQATFVDGGSGVVVAHEGALETVASTGAGELSEITSHPAFVPGGVTFYARARDGGTGVYVARGGTVARLDGTGDRDTRAIGPLGPTSARNGLVAYRATASDGAAVVRVGGSCEPRECFRAEGALAAFFGLPVVTSAGAVLVRIARTDGTHALELHDGSSSTTVLSTGGDVAEIGLFPSEDAGTIVTSVRLESGTTALVAVDGSRRTALMEAGPAFAHVRGGLVRDGHALVIATSGDTLGIFAGPDPTAHRVVALGDMCLGSKVTDLAANPVSIGLGGRLAVRVALADGREAILTAVPNT